MANVEIRNRQTFNSASSRVGALNISLNFSSAHAFRRSVSLRFAELETFFGSGVVCVVCVVCIVCCVTARASGFVEYSGEVLVWTVEPVEKTSFNRGRME